MRGCQRETKSERDQRKGKVSESEMVGREEIQLVKGKEKYQSERVGREGTGLRESILGVYVTRQPLKDKTTHITEEPVCAERQDATLTSTITLMPR